MAQFFKTYSVWMLVALSVLGIWLIQPYLFDQPLENRLPSPEIVTIEPSFEPSAITIDESDLNQQSAREMAQAAIDAQTTIDLQATIEEQAVLKPANREAIAQLAAAQRDAPSRIFDDAIEPTILADGALEFDANRAYRILKARYTVNTIILALNISEEEMTEAPTLTLIGESHYSKLQLTDMKSRSIRAELPLGSLAAGDYLIQLQQNGPKQVQSMRYLFAVESGEK